VTFQDNIMVLISKGQNVRGHSLAFQPLKMRPLHIKMPWSSNKR